MTNTKFIDAHFFEGDATALEDRLREFLQTFRKRKMAQALMVADDCKPELDHLEIDDFGDDLLRGANISVADNRMIRRRAALVFQRRMAASGLAHLKADEVKRLSVMKSGAILTPPGNEAWADELAAILHAEMPWMAPATETAWHALRRSAQRGDPGLRLPPMLLNGPAGIHHADKEMEVRWYPGDIGAIWVKLGDWVKVGAVFDGFAGVRAQDWITAAGRLRATLRKGQEASQEIVYKAIREIVAMNAAAKTRAKILTEDWSEEALARVEDNLFQGFFVASNPASPATTSTRDGIGDCVNASVEEPAQPTTTPTVTARRNGTGTMKLEE